MKDSTKYIVIFLFALMVSCKKEKQPVVVKVLPNSTQTLQMQVNGLDWITTSTNSSDREALHGQLTELGNNGGTFTSIYTVSALKK